MRAVFYGLGADGTVGANKNSVKILAEDGDRYAQGYFVYDCHKSGAQTVSHLRFGPTSDRLALSDPHRQFRCLPPVPFHDQESTCCKLAMPGATFLLNAPFGPDEVWNHLPRSVQKQIIDKKLKFYVIDATAAARDVGLGSRTNTILQTCFFALSRRAAARRGDRQDQARDRKDLLPARAARVVEKNFAAVDGALARLHEVDVPATVTSTFRSRRRPFRPMRPTSCAT